LLFAIVAEQGLAAWRLFDRPVVKTRSTWRQKSGDRPATCLRVVTPEHETGPRWHGHCYEKVSHISSDGAETMRRRNSCDPALEAEAVIHRVDPVNRELAALVEGGLVMIYVPPACDVILRGERIKLRMVQPRDRVRVTYTEVADSLVARAIEVLPGHPTSSLSQ
jgi:hypothetical protein